MKTLYSIQNTKECTFLATHYDGSKIILFLLHLASEDCTKFSAFEMCAKTPPKHLQSVKLVIIYTSMHCVKNVPSGLCLCHCCCFAVEFFICVSFELSSHGKVVERKKHRIYLYAKFTWTTHTRTHTHTNTNTMLYKTVQ